MKKGILQRVSKNWEEIKMAPPPEVKQEPLVDYPEPLRVLVEAPLESNKVEATKRQADVKKVQRDSMIAIRKDYSYKYVTSPSAMTPDKLHNNLEISSPSSIASPPTVQKREALLKPAKRSIKSPISILERYDYHKPTVDQGPSKPKLIKIDNNKPSLSAIPTSSSSSPAHSHPPKSHHVPIHHSPPSEKKKELKVIVAAATTQEEISPVVKQEVVEMIKSPSVEQQKDAQSTKINNKINIIFQLNDNKSLRKNIILHRRTPKKMVQKITIKETNNNTDEANLVPEKVLCSIDTQTESDNSNVNLTTSNPLNDEVTEHLFFDDDVLISLQRTTISFFEYNRLGSLLKKGETDFKLIDRIPRRLHDTLIDSDNKFQCLCYNDQTSLPIYVEMRAKQKELDDPEMCPIAFLYCNVYYIDQRRAKFSSVHLDTVKSVIDEIMYTCLPHSSYFIMAWNEKSPDTKGLDTGIVKYKLTPNLDLAKLASIRQFPKLNYRTKQINCGKDSQLLTFGESQVSIFNYESGDLLMSLDLMKSYGTNLTTFGFKENYLFMVYLADSESPSIKRVIVIGVNKFEGNTFKVIQSSSVKLRKSDKITSKSITSTNHLLITFSNGSVVMMHLNNFRDIHIRSPSKESFFAAKNHLLVAKHRNVGLRNFTEFFLN